MTRAEGSAKVDPNRGYGQRAAGRRHHMIPGKFTGPGLGLGLLAAALLAPSIGHAQVSDDVVKIGVLTDMNGPASSPTGKGSVTAAQMAVEDFGGSVLGKPISVVVGDHQLKPDIGGGAAPRRGQCR